MKMDLNDGRTIMSDCGKYRYQLHRALNHPVQLGPHRKPNPFKDDVIFVMKNPSTADADKDDPTIRKCKRFSFWWGYRNLWVINLFAYRSRYPKMLMEVDDPVGPDNDLAIAALLSALPDALIVCAWGNLNKTLRYRHDDFLNRYGRDRELKCFKVNDDGTPCHPLYQRNTSGVIIFNGNQDD